MLWTVKIFKRCFIGGKLINRFRCTTSSLVTRHFVFQLKSSVLHVVKINRAQTLCSINLLSLHHYNSRNFKIIPFIFWVYQSAFLYLTLRYLSQHHIIAILPYLPVTFICTVCITRHAFPYNVSIQQIAPFPFIHLNVDIDIITSIASYSTSSLPSQGHFSPVVHTKQSLLPLFSCPSGFDRCRIPFNVLPAFSTNLMLKPRFLIFCWYSHRSCDLGWFVSSL